MAQNGSKLLQKWLQMAPNGSKWLEMPQNGSKWLEMAGNA